MKSACGICVLFSVFAVISAYASDGKPTKKSNIKFRGLDSVDTFNVSYAKFSPFNNEDKERNGSNVTVKARVRPVRIGKLDIGGYFVYSNGVGETRRINNNRLSHADYTTIGGGVSGVYNHTKNISTMGEVGILRQSTDIWVPEKDFTGDQKDWQWEVRSSHTNEQRRSEGKLFFPQWMVDAHYLDSFDVTYSDSIGRGNESAYDSRRFRVGGAVDIYDWYINENWRITPTFNANLGYICGKDSGYLQGGLGSKLSVYDQEMVDIKLLNPRWMFGGDGSRIYNIGTIKPYNVGRVIWATQTETYVSKKKSVEIARK